MEKYEKISESQIRITKTDEQIIDTNDLKSTLNEYTKKVADINEKIKADIQSATDLIQKEHQPEIDSLTNKIDKINSVFMNIDGVVSIDNTLPEPTPIIIK